MVGQGKVMFPWFTKDVLESFCHSDDALENDHWGWLPVDLGSGPNSLTHSLCNTGHAPEPL